MFTTTQKVEKGKNYKYKKLSHVNYKASVSAPVTPAGSEADSLGISRISVTSGKADEEEGTLASAAASSAASSYARRSQFANSLDCSSSVKKQN